MNKRIEKSIGSILSLCRNISILDVGARGGLGWPWRELNSNLVDCILIEPDPLEAKRLEEKLQFVRQVTVLPYAFWRDQDLLVEFNLNRSPGTSSVYPANRDFLNQFPDASRFDVVEKIKMLTTTIDYLEKVDKMPSFDFAKIDIQGGELAVLEGGVNYLKSDVVGLELEVEFAELYTGQPLFADVDYFVREKIGLELWDLSKSYWKYAKSVNVPGSSKGRLIFGNALYFRSISGLESWLGAMSMEKGKEKLLMLVVAALSYGYTDYAETILKESISKKYLNNISHKILLQSVNSLGNGFRPFRKGNAKLYWIFNALANSFKVSQGGWGTSGDKLGSSKRGPFWY